MIISKIARAVNFLATFVDFSETKDKNQMN